MRKREVILKESVMLAIVLLAVFVCVISVSAGAMQHDLANVYGNGYNIRTSFRLESKDNSKASGTASVVATSSSQGDNNVKVILNMKNLPVKDGKTFEAWLVNRNMDKVIYLGSFKATSSGNGYLLFCKRTMNFVPFSYVLVTQKTSCDDLKPVLFGDLSTDP